MTADVILIIAGCFLMLVGVAGGGIRTKYGTVKKIEGAARISAGAIGLALVVAGVAVGYLNRVPSPSVSTTPAQSVPIPQPQVYSSTAQRNPPLPIEMVNFTVKLADARAVAAGATLHAALVVDESVRRTLDLGSGTGDGTDSVEISVPKRTLHTFSLTGTITYTQNG